MTPDLLYVGPLAEMAADVRRRLLERGSDADPALVQGTARIIARVRSEGDAALYDYAQRFDGVALDSLEVSRRALRQALDAMDPALRETLDGAAGAIANFHRALIPDSIVVETSPGVRLSRISQPLARAGVYVPGGRAAYPSSVLMGVIPARIAGVGEIVVCSPPGSNGLPDAAVLGACAIARADRVFAVGGAGAIAALAYGTETVPRADRIVGPGNAWVAEAKRQVNGVAGIDCPAGPSEILIIADETADADLIAAEMIAQAEHDPDATAALVTTARSQIENVRSALLRRMEGHARKPILEASLARHGALVCAGDIEMACRFATDYAPEHLLILTMDPHAIAGRVRNAGTIFLGPASSVVFGDYVTGANHVLPTGGSACAFNGLSIADFLRSLTLQEITAEGAATIAPRAALLADAEGFPGHAAAARLRIPGGESLADGSGASARTSMPRFAGAAVRLREDYSDLRTYDPGRQPCEIDLSDNTNLWGPAAPVREALATIDASVITRYPSVYADRLRNALAERLHVAPGNIATGCGSDDVIDSTMRAFTTPGDRVALPWPTFGMVPVFARMNGLDPITVPLRNDLELDVDALIASRAEVTYVCRPNNPTGTLFRRADVEALILHAAGLVIVDEAYIDFAGDDLAGIAIASERAVILRTFSKVYGLAGLRVGFAIGASRVIAEIEKSRGPYKVSSLAEAAALAVLETGRDAVDSIVRSTLENRARLTRALTAHGHTVLPSAANFVLVRVPDRLDAQSVSTALRAQAVAVRPFTGVLDADWIRVTVGPWPLMQRFLDAFDTIVDRDRAAATR